MNDQGSRTEFWTEEFRRFSRSGMSAQEYCESRRLGLSSFYGWRRRLNVKPTAEGEAAASCPTRPSRKIVSIPVLREVARLPLRSSPCEAPPPSLQITAGHGVFLVVPEGVSVDWVSKLVMALRDAGGRPC